MTTISCEVKNCYYNKDGGCKLEGIKVGTSSAEVVEETMCQSYVDKDKGSATSSCACHDCACDYANVNCSATACVYNENGICDADSIDIGCQTSKCSDETECQTFEEK